MNREHVFWLLWFGLVLAVAASWQLAPRREQDQPIMALVAPPVDQSLHMAWHATIQRLRDQLCKTTITLRQASAELEQVSQACHPDYLRGLCHVELWNSQRLRLAANLLRGIDMDTHDGDGFVLSTQERRLLQEQFEAMQKAETTAEPRP